MKGNILNFIPMLQTTSIRWFKAFIFSGFYLTGIQHHRGHISYTELKIP